MNERKINFIQKHGKKKNRFIYILLFSICILLLMFTTQLSLFNIEDIEISGNVIVESNHIKEVTGLNTTQNIFSFSSSKANKELVKNPYIKSVKVSKKYPNKININIVERKPRAYIEFKNADSYLLIDENGMVLDVKSYAQEELPVIVGLNFSDFVLGQVITVENTKSFEDVVVLSNLFNKYDMIEKMRVEIADSKDIHLHIGLVDVIFGGTEYADEKIATVKAALPSIPEDARGFLDVSENEDTAVFRYLK